MRRIDARIPMLIATTAALIAGGGPPDAAGDATARDRTLRVLKSNPRYFTDGSGRAVYLTGSHVWWHMGDRTWFPCSGREPAPFDYPAYLDRLRRYGHNFLRFWRIEVTRWTECGFEVNMPLQPWLRTGPGLAADGLPRFDLSKINPEYFARLRTRVAAAIRKGFYVSVMLFEGWHVQFLPNGMAWRHHPFNPANNVNGVNGDVNGDGRAVEIHTLTNPQVRAIQDAYVRRVIDTVNRFDKILYEVANESGVFSTAWQYRMIRFVRAYERRKPKRHPIGMTYQHGDHAGVRLLASAADWISPFAGGPAALTEPPAADGRKVVLLDTDHLCGVCGGADFVWRSFVRGHNPIYMDPLDADGEREAARRAMGQTRRFANSLPLARMHPRVALSSTRFCLAAERRAYVVYQPHTGSFWVDLGSAPTTYRGEWVRPTDGAVTHFTLRRARGRVTMRAPFAGPAVVVLRRAVR
jgi:Family of unknown function (DUF6298)